MARFFIVAHPSGASCRTALVMAAPAVGRLVAAGHSPRNFSEQLYVAGSQLAVIVFMNLLELARYQAISARSLTANSKLARPLQFAHYNQLNKVVIAGKY